MPPRLTTDTNYTNYRRWTPVTVNYNNNETVTFNGEAYKIHNQNPFWIDLTNGNWTATSGDSVDVWQYNEAVKSAAERWAHNHNTFADTAFFGFRNELIIKNITMEESLNSLPLYKIEIDYCGTTIEIETTDDESFSALKDIVASGKTIHDLASYCAENNSRVTCHSYDSAYCNGVDSVFMKALEKKEPEVNESDWKSLFAATSAAGS